MAPRVFVIVIIAASLSIGLPRVDATVPVGDVGGIPKHLLQVLLLGTVGDPVSILGKTAGILTEDLKKLDINTQERDKMKHIMETYYGESQELAGSDVGDHGSNQDALVVAGVKASDVTDKVIASARKQAQQLGLDPSHLNVMEELNNQMIRNLMFTDVINKLKEAGAGPLTLVQRKALSNQIEAVKADMRNQTTVNQLAANLLQAISSQTELAQTQRGASVVSAMQALGMPVDFTRDLEAYGGVSGYKNAGVDYDFQGSDHMTYEQYLARYGRTSNPNTAGNSPNQQGADPGSLPPGNGSLADSAYNMIGTSTANIDGTDGGNLGCAAAVSMMFKNATGQNILPGQETVLGTGELYSGLSNDPRFVKVSLSQAQPGDIVVTARGSKAGHTGIVGNNGEIISNSSSGFNGGAKGTIQNNYTIAKWQSSIAPRNPSQTAAFRYVGG